MLSCEHKFEHSQAHRSIRITQLQPTYSNTTMSSYTSNTSEIDSTPSQASISASASTLPSAFNRMIGGSRLTASSFVRDQCTRPIPKYNSNYNLYKLPPEDFELNYSPYTLGELLHDNRLPFSLILLSQHTLADTSKRRQTSWV